MGKELNEIGVQYFILEKSSTLGGVCWQNINPGVACDVPSHLYSFSFYTNPNWSRGYSPGKEICEYLNEAASHFDVYPKIKFNQNVVYTQWHEKVGK